jgi:parallel beta-helix repeat protein
MSGTTAGARLFFSTSGALSLLLILAAGPALAVECGEVITGHARLERDLICTSDPALTVDGGTLDLGGFTVVCDHPPPPPVPPAMGIGVLLEGSGARLGSGAVSGCFLAVHVAGEGGHAVRNLTASAAGRGVLVESDGNRLLGSHILRALDDAAVQVDGSDNLLRGNEVAGASDQGFEINGSDNRVVDNRIAAVAEGVQLLGERNHVLRNQIVGATDRGIDVRGLEEPTGAHLIAFNLIVDGVDGIATLESSNGNRISRNTIYGNSDQGIFVGTMDNTITRNQALLNLTDLQDNTPGCDDNLWRDNTFDTSMSDTDCIE